MRVDGGIKGETHTWRRRRCHSFDLTEHVSDRAELGEISIAREIVAAGQSGARRR
jgi:hypothetical protein